MRPLLTKETCVKISPLQQALVLVDGDAYYRAFYDVARTARRSLCMLGWQFDTLAQLLPNGDQSDQDRFLPFLNALCEAAPELRVFIGVWDYSLVYAIEREWFQRWKFEQQAHARIEFRLLRHPQPGGAHHQKIVVVDERVAFTGGFDVCDERWDERSHAIHHPRRINVKGRPYGPFHDVQVMLTGRVVRELSTLFWQAWSHGRTNGVGEWHDTRQAGPDVPRTEPESIPTFSPDGTPLSASRVGLSRTIYGGSNGGVYEVQRLYECSIAAAERLIYIENQYFTSRAVTQALAARLSERHRAKLQILLVMPNGGHSKKEQFVLGSRQRLMLCLLSELAHQYGHQMRLLMSCPKQGSNSQATYIHSKLMIVDDRLLTIGSANLMNRSFRVDYELNVSFDAALEPPERAARLTDEIASLRASLLAEHAGLAECDSFRAVDTLVKRVDEVCELRDSKLACQALRFPPTDGPLRAEVFDPSGPFRWESFDVAIEQALSEDHGPVRSRARRFGQRLGLVDIE